jgi:hypothetical protein
MASIDQVWDHNTITKVTEFSAGVVEWEVQHKIQETDQPESDQIGAFMDQGWAVQGTVTNEQQQGDTVTPARLRFSGGINTNGSVSFTVRTAESGGANQQDYPIADVAPRMLTAANMVNGAFNRVVATVPEGDIIASVVEISEDVYDLEMLADGTSLITDVAFIQLVHTPGDAVPTAPD